MVHPYFGVILVSFLSGRGVKNSFYVTDESPSRNAEIGLGLNLDLMFATLKNRIQWMLQNAN
jgi:hypothetical protein